MSSKLVVLAALVATCCAKPYFYSALPDVTFLREARAPAISYGYGTSFASKIADVKSSFSTGAALETGDGQAYGGGFGSTDDDKVIANGVAFANGHPAPAPAPVPIAYRTAPVPVAYRAAPAPIAYRAAPEPIAYRAAPEPIAYRAAPAPIAYRAAPLPYNAYPYSAPYYSYPYNVGYNNLRTPIRNNIINAPVSAPVSAPAQNAAPLRDSYGNVLAIARNTGSSGNSLAQSQNSPLGATASAINLNNEINNLGGFVVSYAESSPSGSNSKSFVQSYNEVGDLSGAIAASENDNGAKGSTSQTFQQKAGEVTNSGATAIDGNGIQATHAHSNNNNANKGARTFY